MGFEIKSVKIVYSGWAKFRTAEVATPGGDIIEREIEDHGVAAAILPYDPARKTAILISQFRTPVAFASGAGEVVEAIAGIIDDGNPLETARREALEEAGLALDHLELVGTLWTAPGISTERMSIFLAPFSLAQRVTEGGGLAAEHEAITVHEVALSTLAQDADAGRLTDLKTFALVQTLRLKRPDLFV